MSELLNLGEYAAYVWTCYGLFLGFLLWDLLLPALRLSRLKRELSLRSRREAARNASTAENPIP
jgi:heme exporter protein CcmD